MADEEGSWRNRLKWFGIYAAFTVALFAFFQWRSKRDGGMGGAAYHAIRESINQREGAAVKDLVFMADANAPAQERGNQYVGSYTRPTGEVAHVRAWVVWFSNAKWSGYNVSWEPDHPTSQPATVVSLEPIVDHRND